MLVVIMAGSLPYLLAPNDCLSKAQTELPSNPALCTSLDILALNFPDACVITAIKSKYDRQGLNPAAWGGGIFEVPAHEQRRMSLAIRDLTF